MIRARGSHFRESPGTEVPGASQGLPSLGFPSILLERFTDGLRISVGRLSRAVRGRMDGSGEPSYKLYARRLGTALEGSQLELGAIRLDRRLSVAGPDDDAAVRPGTQELRPRLLVHLHAQAFAGRRCLTAHDELRLCPGGQRGEVRLVAAMMRRHQHIISLMHVSD